MSSQARTTIVDGLLFDGVSPLRAEATIVVEGENIMSMPVLSVTCLESRSASSTRELIDHDVRSKKMLPALSST